MAFSVYARPCRALASFDRSLLVRHMTLGGPGQREGGLAVAGTLEVRGISRPLIVPATVAEDADGGASLLADVDIDRSAFGMTKNPLGMLRGVATVSVVACFRRDGYPGGTS